MLFFNCIGSLSLKIKVVILKNILQSPLILKNLY